MTSEAPQLTSEQRIIAEEIVNDRMTRLRDEHRKEHVRAVMLTGIERAIGHYAGELATAREELEKAREDAARFHWLERQTVEVRTPCVFGSRENFIAKPDGLDGDDESDLRELVDAARCAETTRSGISPDAEENNENNEV